MKAMKRTTVVGVLVLGLASGCAGYDEGGGKSPEQVKATPEPEPEPEPKPEPELPVDADLVQVTVASVQLQEDCPAAAPAAKSMPKPTEPANGPQADSMPRAAARKASGFAAHCVQSRVLLAIASDAQEVIPFSVKAVRLKKADDGAVVGALTTREPQVWADSKYDAWDQSIAAGADIKVGYALGGPDWGAVGKAVGGDPWGPLYILEFDVEIDGRVQTIVSPKVPRDEPMNVVT